MYHFLCVFFGHNISMSVVSDFINTEFHGFVSRADNL